MNDACCEPGGSMLRDGLSDPAIALSVGGFAALWAGRACDPKELIAGEPEVVAAVVEGLVARGRCEIDESGRLLGIHGLTLRSTRHRFEHAGASHATWCAFDSVGIPAALRIDAVAVTDCPACGAPIRVELREGEPTDGSEPTLWLPNASGDHLMESFCSVADLYCSRSHLEDRLGTGLAGEVADLHRAVELGRATWADCVDFDLDARRTDGRWA